VNISLITASLILPLAQLEQVGTVSMDQCFPVALKTEDRRVLQEDITHIDGLAADLHEELKAAEEAASEDSTELQKNTAKLLRAKFELFRLREQKRLRIAEEKMFNDAFRRIEEAVRVVAKRKACSIVLYQLRPSSMPPSFTTHQILDGIPRAVVLSDTDRLDITEDVLTLLRENEGGRKSRVP